MEVRRAFELKITADRMLAAKLITLEQWDSLNWDVLELLGFTREQVSAEMTDILLEHYRNSVRGALTVSGIATRTVPRHVA